MNNFLKGVCYVCLTVDLIILAKKLSTMSFELNTKNMKVVVGNIKKDSKSKGE